ncbi:5'-nucleotidase/2',3'-cyclic-nucleotide 2'-phosphodiesterase/3'-nucleotidase/5'-nucleotidase [Bacillus oleivorans]|uniref:5'-nucleotidase/2',3'-cyclic-nucleotide 2'-phosphodiesterase/3'-nucleotidase/5'-nucleotidase n=1 Tax=Bacillus oleivorans TaxID=1448271 RepID=A0A285CJL7_9BACI|nr:5'-nucleotidase C-terminal domain-containing protein [Bacillus oleivorans]SNX67218.1 5'-nucleotidase/2',3'-cyclic-nucleotide 2'-phosphodiesterase/3'-nucleotidase/5'-nucleotidase [Bacillus oleivorans]
MTPAVVSVSYAEEAVKFSDVADDYWAAAEIYSLVERDIINGFVDGTFRPEQPIIRGQVAILLKGALGLPVPSDLKAFKDVSERSVFAEAVAAVKQAGIFYGSEGKFGVGQAITHEQMASVLVRAFDLKFNPNAEELTVENVTPAHEKNVEILAQNGIITKEELDSFEPKASVSRAEFAVYLYRTLVFVEEKGTFELSIMHTNDTHAHLDKVAKRVTAVNEIRAKKPDALLLDAGDVFSGTLYFNEFKGLADLQFMNLMGYDAMTFGNHEFDLGSQPEGHKGLADFIKVADFPFVSANVDFSGDALFNEIYQGGTISSAPENGNIYGGIIKEVDGEKVGIFGLTTEETVNLSSPGKVSFEDYAEAAQETVDAFEAQGVNKIIALTHIGFDDNPAVDNDLQLAELVDGIDIIVGGHSHTELAAPFVVGKDEQGSKKEPTIIVQAYQYGDYLGTLDVEFDENGEIVGYLGELIDVGEKVADPDAAKLLETYSAKIKEVQNSETGAVAAKELANPRLGNGDPISVRNSETELGNLISDGMLDKAKEFNPDTVIAMQNGGGIRAAIDKGPITLGEILTVLPYGNTLATMELTGAEIIAALEHSVSNAPNESGGFLHVAGMKFTYDSSKSAGERVVSVQVEESDGSFSPLDESKTYVVATNNFTAKGGDGFDVFAKAYEEGRVTDLGLADWENLRDYVVKIGTVEPVIEDRIVDVAGK